MSRSITLTAVKAGITRLREKGGATPDSLYDLLNGYVNAARIPQSRPGSAHDQALPAGTKGLAVMADKFVVFAKSLVTVANPAYRVEVLQHPDPASTADLADIHFAMPFLGFLYVVAEWSDGVIRHYWLQSATAWSADTVFTVGVQVQPIVPNGWLYSAQRIGAANPTWTAKKGISNGDVLEPTVANGFKYTAAVTGTGPTTGLTEPTWPTTDGATVVEVSA